MHPINEPEPLRIDLTNSPAIHDRPDEIAALRAEWRTWPAKIAKVQAAEARRRRATFRRFVLSRPTASRAPRPAQRRTATSSPSTAEAAPGDEPPAARAAWARIRAAQVALPVDPELARRLIQQAAADLDGAA